MKSKEHTIRILTTMFTDCFRFWLFEKESVGGALKKALSEVSKMTHNPFDPHDKLLDKEGKQEFIERIERDLKHM